MQRQKNTPELILKKLQEFQSAGHQEQLEQLAQLLTQTVAVLQRPAPDAHGQTGNTASYRETFPAAQCIAEIAIQEHTGTYLTTCLSAILALSPACWPLAVRTLARVSSAFQAENPLQDLPAPKRLLLIHEFLRSEADEQTPFAKWCRAELRKSAAWKKSDIIQALSTLHLAARNLHPELREHLEDLELENYCLSSMLSSQKISIRTAGAQVLCILGTAIDARTLMQHAEEPDAVLIPLIQAAAAGMHTPPSLIKAYVSLTQHAHPPVRHCALRALVHSDAPNLDRVLALILQKRPQQQREYTTFLQLLPHATLQNVLNALSETQQNAIRKQAFTTLVEHAPDIASACITTAGGILKTLAKETALPLKRYLTHNRNTRYLNLTADHTALVDSGSRTAASSKQLPAASKLPTSTAKEFYAAAKKFSVGSLRFSGQKLSSCVITRCEFTNTDLSDTQLEGVTFEGCTFRHVSFVQAHASGCRFENCTFHHTSFAHARLHDCTLQNCTFQRCHGQKSTYHTCSFNDIRFVSSDFAETAFLHCTLEYFDWEEASAWGGLFAHTHIAGFTAAYSDFTGCVLLHTTIRRAAFSQCSLNQLAAERCTVLHTTTQAGTQLQCTLRETLCDEPHILASAAQSRFAHLIASTELPLANTERWGPLPRALEEHVLTEAARFLHTAQAANRFLRQNFLRTSLLLKALGPTKAHFYQLLPMLLCTQLLEEHVPASSGENWPLCFIHGYHPNKHDIAMASSYFSTASVEAAREGFATDSQSAGSLLEIDAVYAMGSVGTVAMTEHSDIDYWISIAPESYTPENAALLSRKLDAISRWAMETFYVEVTFFAMNRDAIRINAFGTSDKESSGSAQAFLLKEEFYRTGIKVCGKSLAWWVTPHGADAKAYSTAHAKLAHLPFGYSQLFVDFGYLSTIPEEEYFGAVLWQIVKALKTPFKAMMKMGLLETYLNKGQNALLCEEIKHILLSGVSSPLQTDPYVLLMRRLRTHYLQTENRKAADLLRTAFTEKLSSGNTKHTPAILSALRKRALRELHKGQTITHDDSFEARRKLGERLRTFFLDTYVDLQEQLGAKKITAHITPQDVTHLGRLIFSALAHKPHKVERLPFISGDGPTLSSILFQKDKTPGKRNKWIVAGLPAGSPQRREAYKTLRADSDLLSQLIWLVANNIYTPAIPFELDMSMSPVAMQDITLLLADLHRLFAPDQLIASNSATVREEHVDVMYCVPNLMLPRSTQKLQQITVIWLTNWRELFCLSAQVENAAQLAAAPHTYLANLLPHPVTAETALHTHMPVQSRAPKLAPSMPAAAISKLS